MLFSAVSGKLASHPFLACIRRILTCFFLPTEPDVLRFQISVLTAASLMEGIVSGLVKKYELEAPFHVGVTCRHQESLSATYPTTDLVELRERHLRRAQRETEGVFWDLQETLSIRNVSFLGCLRCSTVNSGLRLHSGI